MTIAKDSRPNISFITTDEHRFDAIGLNKKNVITPNLDRLATESVFFNRAYTTSPSCVPSRAAMFTGRYPSQHGAVTHITYLNETETTFMSYLQDNGYYTAAIGKQHFGTSNIRKGYDYTEINDLNSVPKVIAEDDEVPGYVRFLKEAGFHHADELTRPNEAFSDSWISTDWTVDIQYHLDHYIGERAKNWVQNLRPEGKPWFLWVSFPGPHPPFDCANTVYAERYTDDAIDMPKTYLSDLEKKPPHYSMKIEKLKDEEIHAMRRAYYANITLIDEKIGELLQTLKETGEYDNTLIVFTSDHGDFLGDFGLGKKGQYLSEVLMRVLLMIKPPVASFQGRVEQAFAYNFDIAATCLQAAGIEIPANMAAKDLSPYWMDNTERQERPYVYLEAAELRGIRTDRWKFIHYRDRPYGELYDLAQDPWERENLWDDPGKQHIKLDMYRLLADQFILTGEKPYSKWTNNPIPI